MHPSPNQSIDDLEPTKSLVRPQSVFFASSIVSHLCFLCVCVDCFLCTATLSSASAPAAVRGPPTSRGGDDCVTVVRAAMQAVDERRDGDAAAAGPRPPMRLPLTHMSLQASGVERHYGAGDAERRDVSGRGGRDDSGRGGRGGSGYGGRGGYGYGGRDWSGCLKAQDIADRRCRAKGRCYDKRAYRDISDLLCTISC